MFQRPATRQDLLAFCVEHVPEDVLRSALKLKEAKRRQDQSKQWRWMFLSDAAGFRKEGFGPGDLPDDVEAIRTSSHHLDEEFIAALFDVDLESLKRQFRKRPKKQHQKPKAKRRRR